MPELRQNLATKEWVIIATDRALRPHEFADRSRQPTTVRPPFSPACPFCPGNEAQTAREVLRWPTTGPWQVRVVPNRFPALNMNGARVQCLDGIHRKQSGVGYHEVLIESPLHNMTLALQPPEEVALTLRAFQTRGREIMNDPRIEQTIYFKNHGPSAGSTLEHPHCQILGLPIVPYDVRRRIEETRATFDDTGVCPYCQMLDDELRDGERIVAANDFFAAFVPYAAPSPFHVWIVPRRHGPTFLDQSPEELSALAALLRLVAGKIYTGLRDPDYNFIIRSAPNRDSSSAYLHWYLTLIPRVTKTAGFELGTGMHINPALPEESAAFLRDQAAPDPRAAGD